MWQVECWQPLKGGRNKARLRHEPDHHGLFEKNGRHGQATPRQQLGRKILIGGEDQILVTIESVFLQWGFCKSSKKMFVYTTRLMNEKILMRVSLSLKLAIAFNF